MKQHKIVREFKDNIGAFELLAQVEELTFESYVLTIYIDERVAKDFHMGSLGQCKQYTYWFVEWAQEFARIIRNLTK